MNVINEICNPVAIVAVAIGACAVLDIWMKNLSARRQRLAMQAAVQSYLEPRKQL